MKVIYKALEYGSDDAVLDSATAYVQAARALDAAASHAQTIGDTETMAAISGLWMQLAENLGSVSSEDEEEEIVKAEKQIGFSIVVDPDAEVIND